MAVTQHLGMTLLEEQQTGKEATINAALALLDRRLGGTLVVTIAADADYTLDASEPAREDAYGLIRVTDPSVLLSTTRAIEFPAESGSYAVANETTRDLVLRVGSGAGATVTVGAGLVVGIHAATSDMLLVGGATPVAPAPAAGVFDLGVFIGGVAAGTSGVEIYRLPLTRALRFPTDLVGSRGRSRVPATASTVFTLRKNGTSFGTATFAASASTATFTVTQTDFAAGDVFSLDAPATPDASLVDTGFTFATTQL